uniref:HTTM domain-containing protein n=1 Tax=Flavobacterium sp. TaxID=239 RepID=UPI00404A478D
MLNKAFKPIDNAPLIVFRIFFGFLIACESFGAIATGWVKRVLIEPQFTFSFIGLEWLQPLSGDWMYYYFSLMGVLGIFIMLGYKYRIAIVSYTILWAGAYFMQKTAYNNHYYLLLLISFYMVFLPANRGTSLDIKFGNIKEEKSMPYWISLAFIIQIFIVYFYASIAKIYPDWLDGTFTKNLLQTTTTKHFFSTLFSQKWFYLSIAYIGIFYDLLIIPLFLFKKTRNLALLLSLCFHIFNAIVLQIGVFPFFALSFILFFYEPEKIRRIFFKRESFAINEPNYSSKNLLFYLFLPMLIIQSVLPLRHHFIKGDVLWTEEGHRLSWRMMLRERSGYIRINIKDNQTNTTEVYNYRKNLTNKQASRLAVNPDYIWQYCQRIKKEYKNKDISIYIDCSTSVNRKPMRRLIDNKVDFAKAEWNYFFHNNWVLLYEE